MNIRYKRHLVVLLALFLLLALLPTVGLRAEALTDGDYEYTVTDGKATITGYTGAGGDVTIPSTLGGYPVTAIGDKAFRGCGSLTSVTIPSSVTSIGEGAFNYCQSLTAITVNSGNAYYASQDGVLFNENKTTLIQYPVGNARTSYTIPSSVTSIGEGAFASCDSLTDVTIPSSVTSIGEGAFNYCQSLTAITVNSGNAYYASQDGVLFNENKTTLIQYPVGNARTSYTIPSSVTSIGEGAFAWCNSLTSVTIPNSVTSIGDYAFYDCTSLTAVTIPSSVTSIGEGAFFGCESLTSVTIPSGVTSIGEGAFAWCNSLTSVTIPNSVTSIGDGAFSRCESLTSVTIPSSVTSIGDYAFYYCTSLTAVTIPSSVTSIGDDAFFGCDSLTSVTIPSSVTSIGDWAFAWCESLSRADFEGAPPTICGVSLFEECATDFTIYYPASLKELWAPNGETTWKGYPLQQYDDSVYVTFMADGEELTSIKVERGAGLTEFPAVPQKTGSFGYWSRTLFSNLTENVTVTALYQTVLFDTEAGVVYNLPPMTTAEDLAEVLDVSVTDASGAFIQTGEAIVIDGVSYTAVVMGDVNCDGTVTATDPAKMLRTVVMLDTLVGAAKQAACIGGGENFSAADVSKILRWIVKLEPALGILN